MRLQKVRFKYDLRKYCFTNRVVNIWNSLPNCVVTGDSTNIFNQDLIHSGIIRIFCMIFVHNSREPEVEVKFRIRNYT